MKFVGDSREEQLLFLFGTQAYGQQKVNEALKEPDCSERSKELLQRVKAACNSRNIDNYLPLTYVFNRRFR
jgi:hypothetical protein